MSNQTVFERLGIYYLGRPDTGIIRTVGGTSLKGSGTIRFSSSLLKEDDTVITESFILGIQLPSGYVLGVHLPASALDSTGTITTGARRGLKTGGYDITSTNPTVDDDLDVDIPDGSIVGVPYHTYQQELVCQALLGVIGSGKKWNARPTYTGTNVLHTDRVFTDATARDAAITVPANGDRCYNSGTGTFQKYAGGAWADDATGTTANASTTVAGKVEMGTAAESIAGTDTGGTGALTVVAPSQIAKNTQNQAHVYAASSAGTDTYAITLAVAPAAWVEGLKFTIKADVACTGASSVNPNTLGAKAIKKIVNGAKVDTETNDIIAGMHLPLEYDGTDAVMLCPTANQLSSANKSTLTAGTTSDADALHTHAALMKKIGTDLTNQTITSGTETDLFSFTVPAGALGINNAVKIEIYVTDFDAVNATNTVFNLKYGATTIASVTIAGAAGMSNLTGKIEGIVYANASASVQEGCLYVNLHDNGGLVGAIQTAVGTGAEASAGALTLKVTVDHPGSGSPSITVVNGLCFRIS